MAENWKKAVVEVEIKKHVSIIAASKKRRDEAQFTRLHLVGLMLAISFERKPWY